RDGLRPWEAGGAWGAPGQEAEFGGGKAAPFPPPGLRPPSGGSAPRLGWRGLGAPPMAPALLNCNDRELGTSRRQRTQYYTRGTGVRKMHAVFALVREGSID